MPIKQVGVLIFFIFMKRNLFGKVLVAFLFCAVFCSVNVNAQGAFSKGDKAANLGLTAGSLGVAGSFEMGIKDDLFGLKKSSLGVGLYGGLELLHLNVVVGARAAFHYQPIDKLDCYGGAMLGFQIHRPWVAFSPIFIGARYYFKEKMGVFAEFGTWDLPYAQIGLSFKF